MSSEVVANNTFPIPDLMGRAFVAIPINMLGLVGNILLFISLIRPSSQLNQPRNRTLTVLAFADIFCCLSSLQYDIETLMPSQHWKSNLNCLIKKTYAIWATDLEYMMMWVIAVDRAMVIKWSMTYDMSPKIVWFRKFLILISFAYATTFTAYAWVYADDNLLVPLCHLVTATAPVIQTLQPFRSLVQLTVIVTHLITYCLSKSLVQDAAALRIQQSILIIAVVYITTSLSMVAVYVVVHVILGVSSQTEFYILVWLSPVASMSFGSNCFILAIRSEQFRIEYANTIRGLKKIFCKHGTNVIAVHPLDA